MLLRGFEGRTFDLGRTLTASFSDSSLSRSFYLPLFFQVVGGANAIDSGLLTLPNMLSAVFAVITSGYCISKWGRYVEFVSVLGHGTDYGLTTDLGPSCRRKRGACW
jgi:hypothetical protein